MTAHRYCSLFFRSCFALSVCLFFEWCLEFRLRPPAGRLEGFLSCALPLEEGSIFLFQSDPSGEGNMLLKPTIQVHPLEEGNSGARRSAMARSIGSSPRGGEICLFSSKLKINTKTNFSKLPVRQSSNHRAGLEVILYLRIWRARLCVGLVECPAMVFRCQVSAWSSMYFIRCSSASSSM